jgi:hypothetical protein
LFQRYTALFPHREGVTSKSPPSEGKVDGGL